MKTKKIYFVEYSNQKKGKLSEMFVDKIYENRHTAETYFSEYYLECLRVNKTTAKHQVFGNKVIDAYSYETFSGERIYRRLREDIKIID